jgi:hypothetical protein
MPVDPPQGWPKAAEIDEVPDRMLASSLLLYDGPHSIGEHEPLDPPQERAIPKGLAKVWVVRE